MLHCLSSQQRLQQRSHGTMLSESLAPACKSRGSWLWLLNRLQILSWICGYRSVELCEESFATKKLTCLWLCPMLWKLHYATQNQHCDDAHARQCGSWLTYIPSLPYPNVKALCCLSLCSRFEVKGFFIQNASKSLSSLIQKEEWHEAFAQQLAKRGCAKSSLENLQVRK